MCLLWRSVCSISTLSAIPTDSVCKQLCNSCIFSIDYAKVASIVLKRGSGPASRLKEWIIGVAGDAFEYSYFGKNKINQ